MFLSRLMPVLRQVLCLDCMKKTQVILKAQRLVLIMGVLFIFLCIFKFLFLMILHFFSFFSLFLLFPYFILFSCFFFCFCFIFIFFFTFLIVDLHIGWAPVDMSTDTPPIYQLIYRPKEGKGEQKYIWSDFFV